MLTISKPLSAGQARRYHAEEFQNGRENYYAEGDRIVGTWHGQLAAQWGLVGDVREDQFERLAEGQHPVTGDPLVRHHTPRTSTNARGETMTTMEHRAGWDATFSAPKSVSLTALVGDDGRVREAHDASVAAALDALEPYTEARLGGNRPAETTGNWVAATFAHDSARPVDGYAAPQLHTHVVIFNLTETDAGEVRPLQPRELFKTQSYATAVYRSELAARLSALGYEIERGESGQPEIRGYSQYYLDASSPRRRQIEEHLAKEQQQGAAAAQVAAHHTREAKRDISHEEAQQQHRALARAFGDQPAHVVEAARANAMKPVSARISPHDAVTFAKERNFEREALVDERAILRDALGRSMGQRTAGDIKTEFESRVERSEFVVIEKAGGHGRTFTTPEVIALEQDTVQMMRGRQDAHAAIASRSIREDIAREYPHLTQHQHAAVDQILANRDQIMALEGVAGAGKTTALAAVRDAAERQGYVVEGVAPTSRAAQKLGEAGIASGTLQFHLARGEEPRDGSKRLYVLDESSLASTKQMNDFLHRLHPEDRVLLVGDVRQHQAVDAGAPYQQLQDAGIQVARLDQIVRQKDPALKEVVEQLSRGEARSAIQQLDAQGRVHEVTDRSDRFNIIAREYIKDPAQTLVVSPDNQSRIEINNVIHRARQATGQVDRQEQQVRVLIPRQDLTGADRQWAEQYDRGDVVRYTKGSRALGLDRGTYARVDYVSAAENRVTVKADDGRRVTYDPRRLQGVTVYREADRAFAVGDRVQFTAPDRPRHVANRELGTIERIEPSDQLHLRLDSGRRLTFRTAESLHLDHGYAVTSHSSQGQTADRVLVHVDTSTSAQLVNRRLAYVAVSRGRYDVQIYTDDKLKLTNSLEREATHRSALEARTEAAPSPQRRAEHRAGQDIGGATLSVLPR